MSSKITKAELEQQYHTLQEEYGRLAKKNGELKLERDNLKTMVDSLNDQYSKLDKAYCDVSKCSSNLENELAAKEESNKKLANQFYAYREELVKCRKEANDWHDKYESASHELGGVRGALKSETDLRVSVETTARDLKFNLAESDHRVDALRKEKYELSCKLKETESRYDSLMRGLEWQTRNKFSYEDRIKELEKKLKEAEKEAKNYSNWYDNLKALYAKIRKEGEEGCAMWRENSLKNREELERYKKKAEDLEHVVDDYRKKCVEIEKIQRKHNMLTLEDIDNALRHWNYTDGKLSRDLYMPLESLIQLLDEYGVNDFCKLRERLMYGPMTDYINALDQVKKLNKENKDLKSVADDLEKQRKELEKKCIELQDRVNALEQRWTDKFNPEDELLGRKIGEWQEYNAVLIKYGVPSPESLDKKLDPFYPKRLTATRSYNVMVKYGINDEKELDTELESWQRIKDALHKHCISPCQLDKCLDQRQRMRHTLREMKKDIEQFNP